MNIKRFFLALPLLLLFCTAAHAQRYVDFVGGSDLYDGTAKSHTSGTVGPWKSSPGMQGNSTCSDNSGAHFGYSHTAGQQIIFKGGVTWPNQCFIFNVTQGGSSNSIRDFYTVDQTWFSGGSFTKPKFDGTGATLISMVYLTASNITIDTFDIGGNTITAGVLGGGACLAPTIFVENPRDNITVTNSLLHDWRLTTAVNQNGHSIGGLCANWFTPSNVVLDHSEVRDDGNFCGTVSGGSCTNPSNGTAIPVGVCGKNIGIAFSNCHDLLEGIVGHRNVHDSQFYNMTTAGLALDSSGGAYHTNVIEAGSIFDGALYGNLVHDVSAGVTIFECAGNSIFNNVMWNAVAAGGDPPIMMDSNCGSTSSTVSNLYNNTVECGGGNCFRAFDRGTTFGQLNAENNHWINTSTPICINNISAGCATITAGGTIGNNVQMTSAAATAQGYTVANKYQPTSSSNSTVGTGLNLTSLCSTLTALCSSSSAGNTVSTVARPSSGAWDAGAYMFGSAPISPILGFSPSPGAFGNQAVSVTSSPITVTVSNTGNQAEVLSTPYFTITGTNATNFSNTGAGTCVNGGTIAISGSCTVVLTFTPSAIGARSATLTIQGTVSATDSLTGTGIAPIISVSPSPIAFSNQNVSTTSSPLTVTISNTGTASEILSTPYFTITGTNAGDFANAGTGSCANGGTIAASSSCTVNLTFTPAVLGSRTANLNILGTVNALASITGTGLQAVVSLNPASIAFGNQTTGTTSGNRAVTLTNTGNATLTISNIALTGINAAEFSTNGSTCGGTLAAAASCSLNVVFSPTTATAKTASLTFTTSAASSPDNVSLTGTGIAPAVPILSFSPSPAAFGNQRTGTTSAPLTVTVSNTGTASEVLSTPYFTLTGPNAASFANAGTGTCSNAGTIAASGSCTINLTYTPSTTGAMSAVLTINGTVSATDSLTGTGVTPIIGISPSPAAFGNQNVSTTSSALTVTVSNTGTSTETLSTPFFTLTGANAADFARTGGTCSNAGTIAASGSCTVLLTFTPAGIGSRSATLTIQGTLSATDSLTGTGIASAVSLVPASILFGNQTTGTTSGNTAVTLTNTGTATLNITSIALTGANAAEFSTNGSTCGSTLAVSASCGLNVAFSPVSIGSKTASLTFTTDAATSPDNIALTGTGTAVAVPSLSFSPTPIAFGNQTQGTTSVATTLTVTNSGTANEVLATPYFTITGANPTSFANSGGGTCANGATIAPSASCTILLTFTPSTTGALAATVNVLGTVNGSNGMTGTGIPVSPAAVTLSPTSIAYGNQDDGTSSPPTSVRLTNSGTGTLTITSITLTGANATEFSIDTNTCGASLAPSAFCTWNVVFSPATAGSKSASVTVTTNALTSPDAVTLTGTGRVPTPPTTPAPAITIVTILPPGSVVVSVSGSGVTPRNVLVSATGCSQDGLNYQNPCRFSVACGNCGRNTVTRWNGTVVGQTFSRGVVTASVPITLIPIPSGATNYQLSLSN